MDLVAERLVVDLQDAEYRQLYAENLLNASVASQIKVLREQRGWTQAILAKEAKMSQSTISEMEDPDYSSWTLRTLKRLAKVYDVRLKVSFEEYGSLVQDLDSLTTKKLQRAPFSSDPAFFLARPKPIFPASAVTNPGAHASFVAGVYNIQAIVMQSTPVENPRGTPRRKSVNQFETQLFLVWREDQNPNGEHNIRSQQRTEMNLAA